MEIARPPDDVHPSAHLLHKSSKRFELPSGKLRSFVTDVLAVVASSLKLYDSSKKYRQIRSLHHGTIPITTDIINSFLIFLSDEP